MRHIVLSMFIIILSAFTISRSSVVGAQNSAPATQVTQVDTSRYPQITIYVAVNDTNGRPLTGLTPSDFTLTEDNTPVDIVDFSSGGSTALSVLMVMDRSGSMEEEDKLEGAQDAAHTFVSQMRPGDKIGLAAFNEHFNLLQPFTSRPEQLQTAIDRLYADGSTAIYDSVIEGVTALKELSGRRVLLLLTDGRDCSDPGVCPAGFGSNADLDEAINYANDYDQSLYVVGLGERDGGHLDGINEEVLQRLAVETGGNYFYAPQAEELSTLYSNLAGSLHEEYTLTYISPRPSLDGTRRNINVRVGQATVSGGYTEQHLINVQSHPLVGLLLLFPLIGLLLLPTYSRKWKRLDPNPGVSNNTPSPVWGMPTNEATSGSAAIRAVEHTLPATQAAQTIAIIPGDVYRCVSCDTLLRSQSRFCSTCGAAQPTHPVQIASYIFCDQCGGRLHDNAHFCHLCGVTLPSGVLKES